MGKRAFPLSSFYYAERNARNFLIDMELSDQALVEALSFLPFLVACPFITFFKTDFDFEIYR